MGSSAYEQFWKIADQIAAVNARYAGTAELLRETIKRESFDRLPPSTETYIHVLDTIIDGLSHQKTYIDMLIPAMRWVRSEKDGDPK